MGAGEFDLIAQLRERLPQAGPRLRVGSGDDAAVVEPSGAATAVSVDAIVEGTHFTLPEYSLRSVGRKALAAGLSDLAAMAAQPGEAYVVVGAPAEMEDDELLELADGLAEVARREGVGVAGGDLTAAPVLLVSVTCVGYEREGRPLVTRAGARPGDALVLTGALGGSAAALELLRREGSGGHRDGDLPEGIRESLLDRQLDPRPRLAAGAALAEAGATAMIDVSDGLGADAGHIAESSGARLEIELARVPLADGVQELAGDPEIALRWATEQGEEFELLASIPPERVAGAAAAVAAGGYRVTEIGRVTEGAGAAMIDREGRERAPAGFDHRRGSLGSS